MQHFLLSKQARELSLKRIVRLSDEEAFAEFVAVRFAENDGEPHCIYCGVQNPYFISTRRKWKCSDKACQRHFSATTDTPFASRKLPFGDLLITMALFCKAPKGMSAIRLSHELNVSYKTAFVMLHKLREAVSKAQHSVELGGEVEIDGGYNGGHVRPHNNKPLRVDRRRLPHRSGKRECVVVMRARRGRTRTFVMSEAEGARHAPSVIRQDSTVYADDNPSFNRLHGHFRDVRRINHQKQYADGTTSTNWAESYFARLDRAEIGIHHHVAGPYLAAYADEMTWREDTRRQSDQAKYDALGHLMTRGGVSRAWKGYWQRHLRVDA